MFGTFKQLKDLILSKKVLPGKQVFANFGLQYNLKCNIRCECCYDLGADASDYLDNANAERWIKECAELDICIYFIAGEPFLNWKWLKEFFFPVCRKYNAKYMISTNAFWGKDESFIDEVISEEPVAIVLSVDYWHHKFVPLQSVFNILKKMKDTKTLVFIASVVDKDHSEYEVDLEPYEKDLTYVTFSRINDRNLNTQNVFTHDFSGHILQYNKIVGTSVYDIDFSKSKATSWDDSNYMQYKLEVLKHKKEYAHKGKTLC